MIAQLAQHVQPTPEVTRVAQKAISRFGDPALRATEENMRVYLALRTVHQRVSKGVFRTQVEQYVELMKGAIR